MCVGLPILTGRACYRVGGGKFPRGGVCRTTHPNEEDFSIVGWGRLLMWSTCTTHPNDGRRYRVTELQSYRVTRGVTVVTLVTCNYSSLSGASANPRPASFWIKGEWQNFR